MNNGLGYVQRDPCMSDEEYESACREEYNLQCYRDEMAARERERRKLEHEAKMKAINECQYHAICPWYNEVVEWQKKLRQRLSEENDELRKRTDDLRAENLKLKKQIYPNYEPVKKIGI